MAVKRLTMGEVLYSAILDDPDDETTALAYADWLEENGGPAELDRAAFIRSQRELMGMRNDSSEAMFLGKQADALLQKHEAAWLSGVPTAHRKRIKFRGGFAREVNATGSLLVQFGDSLFASHPITDVAISRSLSNRSAAALAKKQWWGRVRKLRLLSCLKQEGPLELLLSNPRLNRVTVFETQHWGLVAQGISTLAGWPGLKSVEEVRLIYASLTTTSMQTLLGSPHLVSPRVLFFSCNQLDDQAAIELAGCDRLAELRSLWLYANQIGARGARALASSSRLGKLEHLSLMDNPIGDEGALTLLEGTFPKLELLWLPHDLSDSVKARVKERFPCAVF